MAIAFVQKATATGVNATSITTPAFSGATVVGNVLIGACASSRSAATNTFTFSDSKVNTWTTDSTGNKFQSGNNSCCCAIGSTTLTTAGSSHTVSCNAGSGTNGYQLVVGEFSGLTTTVDQGQNGSAGNSTTALTVTTAATTNANDLVVGIFAGDTNTTATAVSNPPKLNGSTTGVNSLQVVSATTVVSTEAAYAVISSTGTQAVGWTYSTDATGVYAGAVAVYKASASGDVTVALSGQRATLAAGTAVSSSAVTLTGQSATSTAGSPVPSSSIALLGSSATLTAGTLIPSLSLELLGQSGTLTAGQLVPSTELALTGQGATLSSGTVTTAVAGDVTVALTGQTLTLAAGTVIASTPDTTSVPGPVDSRIADTAFRRRKKRRLTSIEQSAQPVVAPIRVGAVGAVQPAKTYDFRSLAELSGKPVEVFRAEIDQEIAQLLADQQERDDEEALTLILATLD